MVMGELTEETEVLVIGGGPGGYAAAFRAADLGLEVTMVDTAPRPGGECLFRGCIPSKTLLSMAELLEDARHAGPMGILFQAPQLDLQALNTWKQKVIDTLAAGLVTLAEKRGIQRIQARALFESSNRVRLQDAEVTHIKYKHAILATGSRPAALPGAEIRPGGRVMGSTGALELADIPKTLLVVGGGYVALELGTVYAALGSRVTLVVRSDRILRGADTDLMTPLLRKLKGRFADILFNTHVTNLDERETDVALTLAKDHETTPGTFERVLIAVGREPNSNGIGLENTAVRLNDHGYVTVDERMQTADKSIYAVGDVSGGPLLAHKAFHQGKVAAEVIAGKASAYDVRAMPAVVYTDPQVAWCGLTEERAREEKRAVRVERYPWKFSSRAVSMDADDGLTKLVLEPGTGRVLGLGIAGRHCEGLIAEGVLAVEMGALAEDVALSIHPHPTLSETVAEAAGLFLGSPTHMLPHKEK